MQEALPPKIVLVDDAERGPTARILASALASCNSAAESGKSLEVETVTTKEALQIDPSDETVILVSVSEPGLSLQCDKPGSKHVACESLGVAQSIVQKYPEARVLLLRQAGVSLFTGIDVAAALLSGIAGIVDDRLLLLEGACDEILEAVHSLENSRNVLLLGEAVGRLQQIKQMIAEWSLDSSSDDTVDFNCFRASMALAQLDRLKPLRGPGDPYSFVKLAKALNMEYATTSFRLSHGDLRKTLSKLADRLLGEGHESFERVRLPSHVRQREFSRRTPVVLGIPPAELPKRLFKIIADVNLQACRSAYGTGIWNASVSKREFKHLYSSRRS